MIKKFFKNRNLIVILIFILVIFILLIVFFLTYKRNIYIIKSPEQKLLEPKDYTIEILEIGFLPSSININKGDKITWVNKDNKDHIIIFDNLNLNFSKLSPGQNLSYIFTKEGKYDYKSINYDYMKGSIIVK